MTFMCIFFSKFLLKGKIKIHGSCCLAITDLLAEISEDVMCHSLKIHCYISNLIDFKVPSVIKNHHFMFH